MFSNRINRKLAIAGGLAVLCILLWPLLSRAIFSARLAWSLQKLASGESTRDLAVEETRVHLRVAGQDYEAILYRPTESAARTAIVLVAGISELGCYHPSLIALSRFLANQGFLVVTPDIREFRNFQISAEPIEQIVLWFREVPHLEGGDKVRKTGLAGISYSGSIALITAAKAEIREQVGFVVAVGPYCNLIRCTDAWFAAEPNTPAGRDYPTRFYAKWVIMKAALDMVSDSKERLFLQNLLSSLLLQKKIPPPDPGLTVEGSRWYRLATMPSNQSDPELTKEIEQYLMPRVYAQLDPERIVGDLRCPVFLIHGAYDDLIAPEESRELQRKTADSHLLVVSFLTHTHPKYNSASFRQRVAALIDALGFCYQFSVTAM
jgi:pimeloyl-ACP methyl ester carboxylesterase